MKQYILVLNPYCGISNQLKAQFPEIPTMNVYGEESTITRDFYAKQKYPNISATPSILVYEGAYSFLY
jgi:hypothetical protein